MWILDRISSFSVVSSFTLRNIVSTLSVDMLHVQPRESRHNIPKCEGGDDTEGA